MKGEKLVEVLLKTSGKTLITSVAGDIDHHNAAQIKEKIDKVIERDNIKNIVFDFSKVSFMDSSGIGMIIGRYKLIERRSGKTAICAMNKDIKRIFDISGLGKIIKVYDSVANAISKIQ